MEGRTGKMGLLERTVGVSDSRFGKRTIGCFGKKASVYVINRENVVWFCEKHHWDFDMIVIDELSSFKSYQAKRFKALRRYRPKAIRVVGLTGTPGNLISLV